jgi:hypothetical protein
MLFQWFSTFDCWRATKQFFYNLANHVLLQYFAIVKYVLETQKLVPETQKWFATKNTVLSIMFYVDAVLYQCFSTDVLSIFFLCAVNPKMSEIVREIIHIFIITVKMKLNSINSNLITS